MPSQNEVAAAILVQIIVDHHPQLQAEVRENQPEAKQLAEVLVPYTRLCWKGLNHNPRDRFGGPAS